MQNNQDRNPDTDKTPKTFPTPPKIEDPPTNVDPDTKKEIQLNSQKKSTYKDVGANPTQEDSPAPGAEQAP